MILTPVSVNKGLRMKYFCSGYDANFSLFLLSESVQFEIHSMLASSSGLSEECVPWLTRKQIKMQAKAVGAKQVSLDLFCEDNRVTCISAFMRSERERKLTDL